MEPITLTTDRLLLRPLRRRATPTRCTPPARTRTSSAGRSCPPRTRASTPRTSPDSGRPDGWRGRHRCTTSACFIRTAGAGRLDGPGALGISCAPRSGRRSSATGRPRSTAAAATPTEAARAAVAAGPSPTLGVERLEWRAEVGNEGSRAVARRGRLRMEGTHAVRARRTTGRGGTPGSARCSPPTWACALGDAVPARTRPSPRHPAGTGTCRGAPAPLRATSRRRAVRRRPRARLSVAPRLWTRSARHDDRCRRPQLALSADEARRIALRAQGLLGAPDRRAGVRGVLRHLGAVQLDTISVLARSHELIPYARLGAVGRRDGRGRRTGRGDRTPSSTGRTPPASCPIEEWPHFAFRRRARRAAATAGTTTAGRGALRARSCKTGCAADGPADGHGAGRREERRRVVGLVRDQDRRGVAARHGEVVCTERRGWKRVYDLAERAVPDALLHDDLDDAECLRRLVAPGRAGPGRRHPRRPRGLPPAQGRAGRRGDRGLRAWCR